MRVGEWKLRKKVKEGKPLAGCTAGEEHMTTETSDLHSRVCKYFGFLFFFPGHSNFKLDGLEKGKKNFFF